VTMTEPVNVGTNNDQQQRSLGTAAARNLATTTKSVPQMQAISSRWLLRMLPWVQVSGGAYRVNRRLSYAVGDGRLTFAVESGSQLRVIAPELRELPLLRGFDDDAALAALADRFGQQEFAPGDVLVEQGRPADQLFLIAHGKVNKIGAGKYGDQTVLGVLADGQYFGDHVLAGESRTWDFTVKAVTPVTVLVLPARSMQELNGQADSLRSHISAVRAGGQRPQNPHGEAEIELASGHEGEPDLPGTFVDYELTPREYELSVAQTVLRVHTRVADLFNQPMNQVDQQLRLTVEALRERQEHELVNNPDFGLLHNADPACRLHTRTGPPTPDDFDELLSVVWKNPAFFLMRIGEDAQGVVGLHQTGIPDEYEPSLSVRFMGIDDKAIISYLVSAYYSAAVLVPDALGVLENVEIGRED
jgi:hypothetical protein